MKVRYVGGHAEVEVISPFTGELVGTVARGGEIEVPDDVAERLSGDFEPVKPAKAAKRGEEE